MPRIARGLCVLTVLGLLVPWTASAATTTTPPTPTPTTPPTPVAPPTPAAGSLRTTVTGVFGVEGRNVTVTGRSMWVNVVATPYVAGQTVAVSVSNGRKLVKAKTVTLRPSRGGENGHASVHFSSGSAGNLKVTAVHGATPQQVRMVAALKKVDVVLPIAGPGSRGMFVSLIQSRLAALNFAVPQDGVYDVLTQNAILAYRKLRGMDRIFTLDGAVIHGLLVGIGAFPVRFPGQGKHVEADLTDQVLALINGSKVYRIYPISSGKPSTPTVLGNYRVYMKTPGYLPDGMYYSNFFYTGYAIHGYDPSPTYPASHGCLRLPIDDAINVYNWIQIGTPVDVYYGAN
jgi:peptidoglycan hydrolase-like protein with peptidoglycan-binding domain